MAHPVVVLTGGPCGGKSALLGELKQSPEWQGRFVVLPSAIQLMHSASLSPREKLFQRVLVHLQMALEDGMQRALEGEPRRLIVCHRGSLDPLAFCRLRGWSEEEFFQFTRTCLDDHLRRYTAVLHLVTAADGAPWAYRSGPEYNRPENPEEAVKLDRWLGEAWSGHPRYFRIDNDGKEWQAKSSQAKLILADFLDHM